MEADGRAASPVAQWLAGGVVLFTGVVTALGLSAGTLQAMMRNHPDEFFLCFGLVVIAIGVGVVAPVVTRTVPEAVLIPGVVALLAGLGGFGYLAITSAGDTQRPEVTASVVSSGQRTLLVKGAAELTGLKTSDYALVRVDGLARPGLRLSKFHLGAPRGKDDPQSGVAEDGVKGPYQVVWSGRSGPATDGTVTVPIKVEIPRGEFEAVVVSAFHQNSENRFIDRRRCGKADSGWGCVEIMLPGASAGPRK
jgi:hypothetical protein